MTEILRVPSIWDYLAGGASQGITSYQEAKQRTREEELRRLGILSSLFNQGAVDNTDLMPALGKAGINANVQPNAPQKQRQIMSSPVNPTTGQPWTSDERKVAGLPSVLEGIEEETKYKYIQGGPITPRQAAVFKLPTDDEIAEGRMLETNKLLVAIAPGYIDATIASMGGQVSPKNAAKIIDSAFGKYTADRQAKGLSVDPAHRSFFGSQVMDRLVQSEKMSLDWHQANSQRISANKPYASSGNTAYTSKDYQLLSAAHKEANDALNDWVRANPGIGMVREGSRMRDTDAYKRYALLKQISDETMRARDEASPGAGARVETPKGRVGTPPAVSDPTADRMAAAIGRGEGTINDAQKLYSTGKLSSAQYLRIKQILGKVDR